jgi:hypothetical protein
MKARIDFDLNDCDEYATMKRMLKADAMAGVLWEFDQWLRAKVKYGDDGAAMAAFESAREQLRETCNSHDINIDEV